MCNIVKSVDSFECKEWFLYKHYAHKMPNIVYSFGLFINDKLSGVCSFGQPPPNFNNSEDICIGIENVRVLELNRLVVNDGLPKNTLSNFVSKCLKLLPRPMIIVSYSDTRQGHNGYIYQATNWIYTGLPQKTGGREYFIDGRWIGNKGIFHKYGTRKVEDLEKLFKGIEYRDVSLKHRYFYFIASKKLKKKLKQKLKYKSLKYPKGNNERYDASYEPQTQTKLF